MAFLKFIDKKGADSFISGIVQFGRLKEYLYIEKKKCVGKNDEMEGKYYTTYSPNSNISSILDVLYLLFK